MKQLIFTLILSVCLVSVAYSQSSKAQKEIKPAATNTEAVQGVPAGPVDDSNYIIGPEDLIQVFVWKEPELTQTLAVRPDGKISLPLLNDLTASGQTTLQLKERITNGLKQYIAEPTVTVIVQSARSRKASIMGEVARPGTYFINGPTNVLQLISLAGGFRDFASTDKVSIVRQENGKTVKLRFNYRDFLKGKNLNQNILVLPGDIIVVP
jgi:polysaccharide biosynthesis/export protein